VTSAGSYDATAPQAPSGAWIMQMVAFRFADGHPLLIQSNNAVPQQLTTTATAVYTFAQLAGDLNVVAVGWSNGVSQVQSITDTAGNTYVLAAGPTVGPGVDTAAIYYATNIVAAAAGANQVTVVLTAPATNCLDLRIAEYGGLDKVNPLDAAAGQFGAPMCEPNDVLQDQSERQWRRRRRSQQRWGVLYFQLDG